MSDDELLAEIRESLARIEASMLIVVAKLGALKKTVTTAKRDVTSRIAILNEHVKTLLKAAYQPANKEDSGSPRRRR